MAYFMSSVGPIRGLLVSSVKDVQQGLTMTVTISNTTVKLLVQALTGVGTGTVVGSEPGPGCRYKMSIQARDSWLKLVHVKGTFKGVCSMGAALIHLSMPDCCTLPNILAMILLQIVYAYTYYTWYNVRSIVYLAFAFKSLVGPMSHI